MRNKLEVTVGTPGTGKSYQLVKKVVRLEYANESYYVMAPTKTAKERLLAGIRECADNGEIDKEQYFDIMGNVHILQYNYHGEQNILIDEFSMIQIDDWYSLLYKTLLVNKQINIYAYGDAKQLPPVRNISALLVLLKSNYKKFNGIDDLSFSEYSASRLYDNLNDMNLDVPEDWKKAIDTVSLKILHKNYRLQEIDGIDDYNDDFYRYIQKNNIISGEYKENLIAMAKNGYLIITPTYHIGEEIDEIIRNGIIKITDDAEKDKKALAEIAPFIRKGKEVYLNPNCKIDYGFDSIEKYDGDKKLDGFKYSFFIITHCAQGTTVDNVVFVMLDHDINKHVKEFYSNNLLYTALTRARYNSYFLGEESVFLQMKSTFVSEDTKYISDQIKMEALKQTYSAIVNDSNHYGRLTNDEILALYHKNFKKVVEARQDEVRLLKLTDKNFKLEPYSDNRILSVMNPQANNEFASDLERLGYGFHYYAYVRDQRQLSGSKGGKSTNGKVKKWVDGLSDNELNQVKEDLSLSMRNFKKKYHCDKRQVVKIFE